MTSPPPAHAQFITARSALEGPAATITFAQFLAATSYLPLNVSSDAAQPVYLTNETPQTPTASQPVVSNAAYNLGGRFADPVFNDARFCTNGAWDSTRDGFLASYPGTVSRISFGGRAIRGVGAQMNYAPVCGGSEQRAPLLRLLDINNVVLDTYDIDVLGRITTPNALNASAFRGALRPQADVYAVEFVGGFFVLDDLSYVLADDAPTPVTTTPEPSTTLMAAAGLSALATLARRRRRRA